VAASGVAFLCSVMAASTFSLIMRRAADAAPPLSIMRRAITVDASVAKANVDTDTKPWVCCGAAVSRTSRYRAFSIGALFAGITTGESSGSGAGKPPALNRTRSADAATL
jgi:hypothetical protein